MEIFFSLYVQIDAEALERMTEERRKAREERKKKAAEGKLKVVSAFKLTCTNVKEDLSHYPSVSVGIGIAISKMLKFLGESFYYVMGRRATLPSDRPCLLKH